MCLNMARLFRTVSTLVTACALLACALPRSGPTAREIRQNSELNGIPIIPVLLYTEQFSKVNAQTFLSENHNLSKNLNINELGVGDKIEITIWESAAEGLYTGSQRGAANLGVSTIDRAGNVFIPYIGNIKVAGYSAEQFRQNLMIALQNKVIDPQVTVKLIERPSKHVSIQGVVSKSGLFELSNGQNTLVSLIAEAGGTQVSPDLVEVIIERQGLQIKKSLAGIYHNPSENIELSPGDSIFLTEIKRTFSVLGASGTQSLVKFPKPELTLIEAIALSGGLQDEQANPTGVFILRTESPEVFAKLTDTTKTERTAKDYPVIYELNMKNPAAITAARQFNIRDGDTLIVSNAPYTEIRKVLSGFTTVLSVARAVATF